jgi:hypothetical protein
MFRELGRDLTSVQGGPTLGRFDRVANIVAHARREAFFAFAFQRMSGQGDDADRGLPRGRVDPFGFRVGESLAGTTRPGL